jgi:hypothetical protein
MSTEDKAAAIGRLVMERQEAKAQYTLLMKEVGDQAKELAALGNMLGSVASSEAEQNGVALLDQLIAKGGLNRLKTTVDQRRGLRSRIEELDKMAAKIGIE